MHNVLKVFFLMAYLLTGTTAYGEKAPDSLASLIPKLKAWGENPTLVQIVKEHNETNISLDEISKRDEVWKRTTGVDDFMEGVLSNSGAIELKKLEASLPFLFECFLMGNQGENISMTNKTSDYWQGDEAKFQKSFNGGAGQVHVGDVKFDESAQVYQVQISVPVTDGVKAIGAITIGVDLDAYEESLE